MRGGTARRVVARVVLTGGLLAGPMGLAGASRAGAATGPDVGLSAVTSAPDATAGKPFPVTFTLTNFGDADAAATRLDVVLNQGNDHVWKASNLPVGCTSWSVTVKFAENGVSCPGGPIAAGASVTRTLMITSSQAGTFTHDAFAYSTGVEDHNNDGLIYTTTVAPATPGGGGNALQALLAALLAALHL